MGRVRFGRSNIDRYETYVLAALAAVRPPLRIFEIGTYDGETTLLLARRALSAEVFTLDVPPSAAYVATVPAEVRNAEAGVGSVFADQREATRITQFVGDRRSSEFSPWFDTVDFVLIDGGHQYETARTATATAARLLTPTGVAVWDDYTVGRPAVIRAVDESGLAVFRVTATGLASHLAGPSRLLA
jgi:predicted O-methyltransferase YrrM